MGRLMVFLAWLSLLLPGAVRGDIYKCVTDGRTAYSEHPCRPGDAPVRLLNDSPVTAEERAAAKRSLDRQKAVAEEINTRNALDNARADAVSKAMRADEQRQKDRCKSLLREAQAADNESRMYRYHQGLIEDAQRRRKEAQDRHFSECFGKGW